MGYFRSHQTLIEFVAEVGSLNVIRERIHNSLAEITSLRSFGSIVRDKRSREEDSKLLGLDGVTNEASRQYLEKQAIGDFDKVQVDVQLPADMRTNDVKCFRIMARRAWLTSNLFK